MTTTKFARYVVTATDPNGEVIDKEFKLKDEAMAFVNELAEDIDFSDLELTGWTADGEGIDIPLV